MRVRATGMRAWGLGCLSAAMVATAAGPVSGAASVVPQMTRAYDLPAQPMAKALAAFARASGARLAYDSALTRGRKTGALKGTFTREAALDRLLADSGLVYRIDAIGTVTILDKSAADFLAQSTVQLDEIVLQGNAKSDGKQTNGPTGIKGYIADNVSAGTKTNTPLIKVPQSISVITRQNLDDRNAQTLGEAIAYTPGVQSSVFGYDPRFDLVYIRGFQSITNGTYRDGLRVANASAPPAFFKNEPYGLDSITVLRGPSAATYGFGSPGGILDLTSKRPVFTQFGEVQAQFGNFDRKQANLDIGGPVQGTDGTIAYRLTGVFRDSNVFPLGPDNRINIAPALTIRPDANTSLTFLSEYMVTRLPGTAAFYNLPNFRVTNLTFGDPAFLSTPQEQYRIGYAFEHKLSDDLIIRQNLRYSGLNTNIKFTGINSISADGLTANRTAGQSFTDLINFAVDTNVEKRLSLGPTRHVLLGGIDFLSTETSRNAGSNAPAPPLNLVTLNYGQQYIAPPPITIRTSQGQSQLGVYLQDQIDLGRATLTLSGRHDGVNTATRTRLPTVGRTTSADNAFTGRAGLNYRIIDGVAPYVSYATTFVPNLGTDANLRPFQATRGDQKEVGIKTQIPSTNLHINGALFDINATNILRSDPNNLLFQSATGAVRSRGYEVEVIDNIAPGTNFVASYTHLDLRIIRGAAGTDGNLLSGIPGDTVAAFVKYQLTVPGALGGLSVGGGVRYAGWSFADDLNTGVNKPYALFDGVLGYDLSYLDPRFRGVRAQVNGYNIFDRYATTCQAGFCYRIQPATVIGSLIYRW